MLPHDIVFRVTAETQLRLAPQVGEVFHLIAAAGEILIELAVLGRIEMLLDEDADFSVVLCVSHQCCFT